MCFPQCKNVLSSSPKTQGLILGHYTVYVSLSYLVEGVYVWEVTHGSDSEHLGHQVGLH